MRRYGVLSAWFVLSLSLVAGAAEPAPPPEAPERGNSSLSLSSAVEWALTNNPSLKGVVSDLEMAEAHLRGKSAYWEPELVVSAEEEENNRQNTTQDQLSMFTDVFEEQQTRYSLAVEGLLGSGARYRIGSSLSDIANNLTNLTYRERSAFESEFVSYAGVSIEQPLLKNGGFTVARSQMKNARLQREVLVQEVRRQKMLTIAKTEIAFWNVLELDQTVALRHQSLEIARRLEKNNRERFTQGQMAEIEVEQARLGVANRERMWFDARAQRRDTLHNLASVMGRRLSNESVVLDTTGLGATGLTNSNMELLLEMAMSAHPDLLIAQKDIELRDLRLKVARNQRWPELDLVGSYGYNGLGDSASTSYDKIEEGEFDSWLVGIVGRLPLGGDREEAAELRKAKVDREKSVERYEATETDVVNALHTAISKAQLFEGTLVALEQEVAVNEMVLDNEKVLLENGKSTSREVLEREEELSKARIVMVQAESILRKLLVQIDLADGGMLVRRGME
jgi:outer membrane protein